ncbi:MAG TPA: hypothetical protein VMW73_12075 [Spirochaetia bacterium]|nr:hypothetical protein [Spirochaetia bacterium]
MKAIVLVPVRFVLVCLILTAVLAGLSVLSANGDTNGIGQASAPQVAGLVIAFPAVFPPAVLGALLIALFPILRIARFRFIPLFLLFCVSGATLIAGIYGAGSVERTISAPPPLPQTISAGTIYRFGDDFLYAALQDGNMLSDVAVYRHGTTPGFGFSPEGTVDPVSGQVSLRDLGETYRISDSETSAARMFRTDTRLTDLFGDIRVLATFLSNQSRLKSPIYLATVVACILYVTSLWLFVRLTRWPLFNGVLAFGALRLLFAGYAFLQGTSFRGMAATVLKNEYIAFIAPAAILVVGLLFSLVGLLLPRFEPLNRGVAGE